MILYRRSNDLGFLKGSLFNRENWVAWAFIFIFVIKNILGLLGLSDGGERGRLLRDQIEVATTICEVCMKPLVVSLVDQNAQHVCLATHARLCCNYASMIGI